MHQTWGKLLFMHWRVDVSNVRPFVPAQIEIDTFDGSAWIAVVPFTMRDTRMLFLPPVPGLSAMHELNVRTYVHLNGEPGVWFFSLDCNSAAAVFGARTLYHLPYYNAVISLSQSGDEIEYALKRTDKPKAEFEATWRVGNKLPASEVGSVEFFLTERYCLYSEHDGQLYQARIHHPHWPLQSAEVDSFTSTMIEAQGIETPTGEPLLHYAEELKVDIWPLRRVSAG